jgi:predicted metal-dependent hydrolase
MVPETARQRGIELFNAREFYECHEVLEDLWRPTQGVERFFLQAVIHFAVGFYHHQRGNQRGAELQLRKGLKKLAGYLPVFQDIDTAKLYREGQAALETILAGGSIERFPFLTACSTDAPGAPVPPHSP